MFCVYRINYFLVFSVSRGVTLFQKVGGTNFRRHRGGGPEVRSGEGAVPHPQQIFQYLLSKRHILVDT